jgi:hypothetical protein
MVSNEAAASASQSQCEVLCKRGSASNSGAIQIVRIL